MQNKAKISLLLIFPIVISLFITSEKPNIRICDSSNVDSLQIKLNLQVERIEKEKKFNFRVSNLFQVQCLLQGTTDNGFFNAQILEEVKEALDKIRNQFPELKRIFNRGGVYTSLDPIITRKPTKKIRDFHPRFPFEINSLWVHVNSETNQSIFKKFGRDTVYRTLVLEKESSGINSIDDLNKKYGVYEVRYEYHYKSLFLKFKYNLDIIRVAETYDSLPEVNYTQRNELILIGSPDEIYLIRKKNFLYFIFLRGNPRENFYFAYYVKNNKIVEHHRIPPTNQSYKIKIFLNFMHGLRPVKPFKSYGEIIKAANSNKWWEKLYALDILGYLQLPEYPRYQDDDSLLVEEIRQKVLEHEYQIIRIFLKNLSNKDSDIVFTACTYLKLKSGKNYPMDDIDKWEEWFKEYRKSKGNTSLRL